MLAGFAIELSHLGTCIVGVCTYASESISFGEVAAWTAGGDEAGIHVVVVLAMDF